MVSDLKDVSLQNLAGRERLHLGMGFSMSPVNRIERFGRSLFASLASRCWLGLSPRYVVQGRRDDLDLRASKIEASASAHLDQSKSFCNWALLSTAFQAELRRRRLPVQSSPTGWKFPIGAGRP